MAFINLVKKRFSARQYLDKKVPRKLIDQCLEASRLAPSACNAQPWRFIVVDDTSLKEKLSKQTLTPFLPINHFSLTAPVIIIVISTQQSIIPKIGGFIRKLPYHLIDIGIAAEHFCLQATELGLGTCIIGWFKQSKIKKFLKLKKEESVRLLITCGYTLQEPLDKKRKFLNDMRSYNLNS